MTTALVFIVLAVLLAAFASLRPSHPDAFTLARIPGDLRDYNQHLLACLHEASHACAVVLLGGVLETVTANQTTRAASCPLTGWPRAVVSMAGGVGAILFGPRVRSLSRIPSEQDEATAEAALQDLGLKGRGYKAQAEERARELLLQNRRPVLAVAQALRVRGSLTGAEVEAIMRGDPLGDAQAAPVVEAQPEAANPAEPLRVVARSWPLKAGGFCASLAPSCPAPRELNDLEAVASTREGALDSLGEKLAQAHGGEVLMSDVDLDAEEDAA